LCKHFFVLVDQYGLANKPVILAATGGSERHALEIEHALRRCSISSRTATWGSI
jgi:FMN reductase